MSILIADSGSSKTDWKYITPSGEVSIRTQGINPYYLSEEKIQHILQVELLGDITEGVVACYFYGAGSTDSAKSSIIENAINTVINPSSIAISSDMLGAARSLLGNDSGVVGILGTGSNSCYYDGYAITDNIAAGGFILGDEGSGASLGKRFLRDYLRKNMPQDLRIELEERGVSKQRILEKVYASSLPNKYLASFSEFIYQHRESDYCQELIKVTLSEFITNHLLCYDDNSKVGLVGSIAFYYQQELNFLAEAVGLNISNIVKSPIEGLVNYHKNQ